MSCLYCLSEFHETNNCPKLQDAGIDPEEFIKHNKSQAPLPKNRKGKVNADLKQGSDQSCEN